MNDPSWIDAVTAPAAADRPQPLWSWNADMDEALIDSQVDAFAAQGCGGVFVHPRPGLVTEYLSPRWFELWRHAARRCAARGIACHIYDENSFPSGFAGGHVVAAEPWRAARILRCTLLESPRPPEGVLAGCADPAYGTRLGDDAWRQAAPERRIAALTVRPLPASAWHAGFALPDISLPGAGAAFIATTHAAYEREAGDHLGAGTRLVFTDEPTLPRPDDGLPWSEALAGAFAIRHGRPLADVAGLLFIDGPGHEAVRHDYRACLNDLVVGNYFRPIHDWCAAHGLDATGHVDEHLWPDPSFLPSSAAALRWMQVPGDDLLAFQFHPHDPASAHVRMARLNLRELDSVARQCGRTRRLVESCGGGGYAYGPADMKRLEDWAMAHGVDLMSPHLAHASLAGARKYDWPQSMSEHSPWWADYRPHADHVARTIAALRDGAVERPVLLLMPTTTAWLHARPGLAKDGPLARLRESTLRLVEALEDAGIAYDLGDECVLAELGRMDGGSLRVGAAAYRHIVLPAGLDSILPSTLALLRDALAAGVPVHAEAACRPAFVAGRRDPAPAALAAATAWRDHADAAALAAALPAQLRSADGGAPPQGLAWRLVRRGDDHVLFLSNPWDRPLRGALRLPGRGISAIDTADGSYATLPSTAAGDGQTAAIDLPPGGHALWWCHATAATSAPARPTAWTAVTAVAAGISTDHPNLLVLDHLELRIAGREPVRATAPRADSALWRAMGFAQPVWSQSIQHRRAFLDHDVSGLPGFSAIYSAEIDPGADLAEVRLGLEQPGLYRVLVNGVPVDGWRPWFDHAMAAAPIGPLLQPGANRIELQAGRFCMRHELAPAYLLGPFALRPAACGFAIAPARPLALGTWAELGRPLACGRMDYAWDLDLAASARALRVRLPRWRGATWRARLDGADAGIATHGQDELVLRHDLAAGRHRLVVSLASDIAGMLGPHHGAGLPGRWSWERAWEAAAPATPPGAAWILPATGLLAPPELAAEAGA